MGPSDLIVRGRRVVTPAGMAPASIHIQGDRIAAVLEFDAVTPDTRVVEAGDLVVMPGIVDTHVHINEPGRTEWEGFQTATSAAAVGGVTTLVDMPLNSIPPTTSLSGFHQKLGAADGQCWVDVGFWGGVVAGNAKELAPMHEAGVLGFKAFLLPSGVDEFAHVGDEGLNRAMPELAELGSVLLVHAELAGPIDEASLRLSAAGADPRKYRTFLQSRPRAAEDAAIAYITGLCRKHRCRTHIVHLSSSDAVPIVQNAAADGLPLTAESCLHYLHLVAEDVPDGATEFKCCPPIRERENREKLWDALAAGSINQVVSDHSPCTPGLKCRDTGNFEKAWGGISSVQLGLSVMWTQARARGFTPVDLAGWMCAGPARFAGLDRRKGAIAPGLDADLVIWDPEGETQVDPAHIRHRHNVTPYSGQSLRGRVEATYLRGRPIFESGRLDPEPSGRLLLREDA